MFVRAVIAVLAATLGVAPSRAVAAREPAPPAEPPPSVTVPLDPAETHDAVGHGAEAAPGTAEPPLLVDAQAAPASGIAATGVVASVARSRGAPVGGGSASGMPSLGLGTTVVLDAETAEAIAAAGLDPMAAGGAVGGASTVPEAATAGIVAGVAAAVACVFLLLRGLGRRSEG